MVASTEGCHPDERIGRMDTRNGLSARLLSGLAIRPAGPGLVLVVALLAVAVSGQSMTSVTWFWPACAALVVLAVVINAIRQDIRRHLQARQHRQRMDTANTLLNDRPSLADSEAEISGSLRELGGLVEVFGHKLDDLLAEVHAEKSAAELRTAAAANKHRVSQRGDGMTGRIGQEQI